MIRIESVFVGADTSGRPLGNGRLYADKALFQRQRDTMAERAKVARVDNGALKFHSDMSGRERSDEWKAALALVLTDWNS